MPGYTSESLRPPPKIFTVLVFLVHDLLACLEDHASEVVLVSIELGHEGSPDGTHSLFLALQVVNFGANQIRVRLEKLQSLLQGNLIAFDDVYRFETHSD